MVRSAVLKNPNDLEIIWTSDFSHCVFACTLCNRQAPRQFAAGPGVLAVTLAVLHPMSCMALVN
jgi:hypothetical protein